MTTTFTGPRRWLGAMFPLLLAALLLGTLNRDDGAGAMTSAILVSGALIVLGLRMMSCDRLELLPDALVLQHAIWGISFTKRWVRAEVSTASYDGERLLVELRDGRHYRMPIRLRLPPGPLPPWPEAGT